MQACSPVHEEEGGRSQVRGLQVQPEGCQGLPPQVERRCAQAHQARFQGLRWGALRDLRQEQDHQVCDPNIS